MSPASTTNQSSFAIEVFWDGDCPLCQKEIAMLRWMDRKKKIRFTDISARAFLPAEQGVDVSLEALMAEIHGRTPDGALIKGVEVFRQLYAAVGLGPLVAISRLPIISHLAEWGYRLFAKNRLRLTGRCTDKCHASDSRQHNGSGV